VRLRSAALQLYPIRDGAVHMVRTLSVVLPPSSLPRLPSLLRVREPVGLKVPEISHWVQMPGSSLPLLDDQRIAKVPRASLPALSGRVVLRLIARK
jgi:hypothetical protein